MKKTSFLSALLLMGISFAAQAQGTSFEVKAVNKDNQLPAYFVFGVQQTGDLNNWFRNNLHANQDFELRLSGPAVSNNVNGHEKYLQYYKGVLVEGSMLNLHYRNDRPYAASGAYYPELRVSLNNTITAAQAMDKAMQLFPGAVFAWEVPGQEKILKYIRKDQAATWYPEAAQVIVSRNNSHQQEDFRLAYKFDIYAVSPISRKLVYIDAADGSVLSTREMIQTDDVMATAHTKYSGIRTIICDSLATDSFVLEETTRGDGIATLNAKRVFGYDSLTDFDNKTSVWNNVNIFKDEAATDVHWALEQTYDYYQAAFGRNSIDDVGAALVGVVHLGDKYSNAFWNGSFANFGDGDDTVMDVLASIDVCAHEITHGMTQMTAGLEYINESGALNESFSDIFGKAVQHYAKPATFDWGIGTEIAAPGKGPLRSMKAPNTTSDPKYYNGTFYYMGSLDNGGVHTNSGVQNYWFYLLCEGGSGTRESDSKPFTVKAIGMDKAVQIAYLSLTKYLFSSADYNLAAAASVEAAKELYGDASEEVYETQMAWYGVGLAEKPEKPVAIQTVTPASQQLSVYPNPASTFVTVNGLHMSAAVTLKLSDLTGQIVFTKEGWNGNAFTLDMNAYAKGIYILECNDQGVISREKIVKN